MQNNKLKYATIAASLFLISCSKPTLEEYKASANQKLADGNVSAAILELKNAIGVAPDDATIRTVLGRLYLDQDLYGAAEKELKRAIDLGDASTSTHLMLIKALFLQDKFEDVVLMSLAATELAQQEPQLAVYEAISLMENASSTAAFQIWTKMNDSDAKVFLESYIYANQGNYEKALELANTVDASVMLEELPMLLGKLHYLTGELEEAVESFDTYLRQRPNNFRSNVYLANSLVALKKIEKATKVLINVERLAPEHPILDQLKSEVALINEDFSEAKLHAENAIAKGFESNKVYAALAVASYREGAFERAYESIEKIPDLVESNENFRKLDLLLRIELGYPLDLSASNVRHFDVEFGELVSFDLIKRGYFNEASDIATETLKRYEEVKELTPAQAKRQATLQLAFGKRELGLKNVEALISNDEDASFASFLLAMAKLSEGKNAEAIKAVEDGLIEKPDFEPLLSVGVQAYLREGMTEKAKDAAMSLRKIQPSHETPLFFDVSQSIAKDDLNAAKKQVDEFVGQFDASRKVKTLLYSLNERTGSNEDNLAYFSAIPADQRSVLDTRLLTLSYLQNDSLNLAESMLGEFERANIDSFYYDVLSRVQMEKGEFTKAVSTYESWIASEFENEKAYIKLMNLHEIMGDDNRAFRTAVKAFNLYPNTESVAILFTHFALKMQDAINGKKGIDTLRRVNPSNITIKRFEGLLAFQQGNLQKGITLLEDVYSEAPSQKHLSELILGISSVSGTNASIQYLKSFSNKYPGDTTALQFYADAMLPRDQVEAEKIYGLLIAEEPSNVAALNNLAWIYNKQGKNELALKLVEKAYTLESTNLSVLSTYGGILLDKQDYGKAKGMLAKAVKSQMPVSANTLLNYAEALIRTGSASDAIAIIEQVEAPVEIVELRKQELLSLAQN